MSLDTSRPVIQLSHVMVTYQTPKGEIPALADVHLDVKQGEFIALVGPSGCGKSTILSLIAGLIEPTLGSIFVSGASGGQNSRQVGYMLQQDFLLPWRTVRENAMIGLELQDRRDPEKEERADDLLHAYGLGPFLHNFPRELSGGMRQRVALVRTLALNPRIFLLDEPFSALDYQTRTAIQEEVWHALKARGSTVVLVTHDVGEAVAMSDRVVVLTSRPARVKKEFTIDCEEERTGPWQARKSPSFNRYVDAIWDELREYVQERLPAG